MNEEHTHQFGKAYNLKYAMVNSWPKITKTLLRQIIKSKFGK